MKLFKVKLVSQPVALHLSPNPRFTLSTEPATITANPPQKIRSRHTQDILLTCLDCQPLQF